MTDRPIHLAGFAQMPHTLVDPGLDEAELVRIVCAQALQDAGLSRSDVGFICSGSSDYSLGRPFSFTMALDGIGPWPPVRESHVESDGAFALYEAWTRLRHGDLEVALVYAYGKSTGGDQDAVLALQLDPYHEAPLRPPQGALAALQARALVDAGRITERDLARVVARCRASAARNPMVPTPELLDEEALLAAPTTFAPLRAHDAPTRTDGAAAAVLVVGGPGPRIAGIAHRIDASSLGLRDLLGARSARLAAEAVGGCGAVEVAELYAPWSYQEPVLVDALGLPAGCVLNPSGGALCADTPMVTGLVRIGEAARRVRDGARSAVGTAGAGTALQQTLVCRLEAT